MRIETAPTRVLRLNGRQRELGPALEHAPADHLYVGRNLYTGGWRLPRSDWHNPFKAQQVGGADRAVAMYETWMGLDAQAALRARIVPELRGKTLLCWCDTAKQPCHASRLAAWADHGFPGDDAFDLECWVDFGHCGDGYLPAPPPRRVVETVAAAGRWSGAL